MSTDITLPTIAGETRIHTLPNRPPFMLIREIAEIVVIKADTLQKAFRRHQKDFPEGYFIVLTEAEFRSKCGQIVRTSRGKRTDLEQVGLTEKGTMLLLTFVAGNHGVAGRIALIDSIFSRHEAERDDMRRELAVDRDAYIKARLVRQRIMTAVKEGWSYTTLRDRYGYSNPMLTTEIQAIRARGYIPLAALPVPQYILRKLAENKAWLDVHAEDTRQLLLGLEG